MTHQIKAWNLIYKTKMFGNILVPVKGLKMAKTCQNFAFFAIFRPLRGIITSRKHFYLVEEVLSLIWLVILENPLRIGFRNGYVAFTSENEVDLDDLHILKIGFNCSRFCPRLYLRLCFRYSTRFCPRFCPRFWSRFCPNGKFHNKIWLAISPSPHSKCQISTNHSLVK